jgi:hypothetical protein
MISREDIIALSGLDPDEVDAIAEHEHIPEVAAAALGAYLLHEQHGPERIAAMIVDDIRAAVRSGNVAHARDLVMALRHLAELYPEVKTGLPVHRSTR